MNRIPQRTQYDCGVAAMAMLYDLSYEQAADALGCANGRALGTRQMDLLWYGLRKGIPVVLVSPREVYIAAGWKNAEMMNAPDRDEFWRFLRGKRAVISVESPTSPGNGHAIGWDGRYLLDPLYKRHQDSGHYKVDDRPVIYDAVVRLDGM